MVGNPVTPTFVSTGGDDSLSVFARKAGETVWGVVPTGRTIDTLELGVVFTTVAGIMNVIVVVDAYETARRDGAAS